MANPRPGSAGDVYTPITVSAGTTVATAAVGPGVLIGFTAAEMSATNASFRLHDGVATGGSATANLLTSLVTLSANQSLSDWYGPQGVAVATGIYVERVSGNTEIVIYGF